MYEEFLHFIYKNKLWKEEPLLCNGEKFEIIDVGITNQDSGPDFFNAKIKFDNTVWAGNVEIHVNSSDWYKHKHQYDLTYNNVILHVVFNNDKQIFYNNNEPVPTWEIKFDHSLFNKYSELKNNNTDVPCSNYLDILDKIKISLYIQKLGIERLIQKTEYIQSLLQKNHNDWEQAFYVCLARNFGFGTNSIAFEQLALNTPINVIRKEYDNLFKIEALLFGQANLFLPEVEDEYQTKLIQEYNFLREKHGLNPIQREFWKFSKLRPANFPHIKLAQLCSLLSKFQGLFSAITNEKNFNKIRNFFEIHISDYWKTHYNFGKETKTAYQHLSSETFDNIAINTIAPFLYLYFATFKTDDSQELAIDWLNTIKPENNRYIRVWQSLGIESISAFETQALIHLRKNYCDLKKCLDCNIGYEIMKAIHKI